MIRIGLCTGLQRGFMVLKTLTQWCDYIATVHELAMQLGLERAREVATRLDLLNPTASVITIAGTNGKGSNVAGLEAIYIAQGYKVGAFTSPYLLRLNEEIRIQGEEVTDAALCAAFEKIEAAREKVTLTVFEFNTLAALLIFKGVGCDVILLEVGLGGRLDAVNIIDADAAVVTSIAIDHAAILGDTRELIAREKAGIFRSGKPVVCGDFAPPESLRACARELSAPFFCVNENFYFHEAANAWGWESEKNYFENLPLPPLALQNMATVLMTVEVMQARLPVLRPALDTAFRKINLAGRIQILPGTVTKIFDVAHNPAAVQLLADKISHQKISGKTHAVFSMLGDKDIPSALREIKHLIDVWHIAELTAPRAASLAKLREAFSAENINAVSVLQSVEEAYENALALAKLGDCVIVFGSFYTVAAVYFMRVESENRYAAQ
jgi:dihydrofolate synthase/folylpolyglutamate synthase